VYDRGIIVARDYAEAIKWFRKVAEHGNSVAQRELGELYAKAQGASHDDVTAYMWFSLAAAQGDKEARASLNGIERKLTAGQLEQAQRLAREWKPTPRELP
jgi:uncharacterized protein